MVLARLGCLLVYVRASGFECEPVYVGMRECLRVFASPSSYRRCRRRLRRFRGPRSPAGAATTPAVYVSVSVPVYVACSCASVYVYARPPIV